MNPSASTIRLGGTALPVLLAAACSFASAQEALDPSPIEEKGEGLVPAAFGVRTDARGNSWKVEPNGAIGRLGGSLVNSGLALQVNGEKFVGVRPRMTADGQEFVLSARRFETLPGVQVQRRVALMEEEGGLRYAEIFYNGSADPVTLDVTLSTQFSGNYESFLSDRGRNEPVRLESAEGGLLVLPGSEPSTRTFLFTLSAPDSAVKPSISAENRYGLDFHYQLRLASGETRALVHHVGRVVVPSDLDRRSLRRLFRPFSFAETAEYRSAAWRSRVANLGEAATAAPSLDPPAGEIASLGVERAERDVLAIGEGTRLVGAASGEDLRLRCDSGEATVAFEQVAAIAGGREGDGEKVTVHLRDGQIFTAAVEAPGLVFEPTDGETIELDPAALDRLVMARNQDDASAARPGDTAAFIATHCGDRLRVAGSASLALTAVTPWGERPVRLDELLWLGPAREGGAGYRLRLIDGTACRVHLREATLGLELAHFGDYRLQTNRLKAIVTPKMKKPDLASEPTGMRPVVRLAGDQRLVGDLGETALTVVSDGRAIEIGTASIRRLERVGDGGGSGAGWPSSPPSFRIERWDGGTLSGHLERNLLSLEVGERRWHLPVPDIERIETPSLALTGKTRTTIETLVGRLGSEDWRVRERATRELGSFGYLAEPMLRRALASATDPEISRRLERILAELD